MEIINTRICIKIRFVSQKKIANNNINYNVHKCKLKFFDTRRHLDVIS